MTNVTCCWLPPESTADLGRPGMTSGDIRAWIDRRRCRALATQEIVDPGQHPCDGTTYSCDAHVTEMAGPKDDVHPLSAPGVWP